MFPPTAAAAILFTATLVNTVQAYPSYGDCSKDYKIGDGIMGGTIQSASSGTLQAAQTTWQTAGQKITFTAQLGRGSKFFIKTDSGTITDLSVASCKCDNQFCFDSSNNGNQFTFTWNAPSSSYDDVNVRFTFGQNKGSVDQRVVQLTFNGVKPTTVTSTSASTISTVTTTITATSTTATATSATTTKTSVTTKFGDTSVTSTTKTSTTSSFSTSTATSSTVTSSTTTETTTSTTTATKVWDAAAVQASTVPGSESECFIALFGGEVCNSEGAVYLVSSTWYTGHFGGAAAIANACGKVVQNWLPKGGHGAYATALANRENFGGGSYATYVAEFSCVTSLSTPSIPAQSKNNTNATTTSSTTTSTSTGPPTTEEATTEAVTQAVTTPADTTAEKTTTVADDLESNNAQSDSDSSDRRLHVAAAVTVVIVTLVVGLLLFLFLSRHTERKVFGNAIYMEESNM